MKSDSWRKFQLLKSLAREGHPISMFSTGNIETLGQSSDPVITNSSDATATAPPLRIRDLMMEFHEKNYSANLMKLVLYSNQSLDAMQSWAVFYIKNTSTAFIHTNTGDYRKLCLVAFAIRTFLVRLCQMMHTAMLNSESTWRLYRLGKST